MTQIDVQTIDLIPFNKATSCNFHCNKNISLIEIFISKYLNGFKFQILTLVYIRLYIYAMYVRLVIYICNAYMIVLANY